MTKTRSQGTEIEMAQRQHPVILLHNAGYSFRRIAELTGVSKSTAQRIYRDVLAETRGVRDIERHRARMFADLEMLVEALRPVVHDDECPPKQGDVASFLRALAAVAKLLGLNTSPTNQVFRVDNATVDNPQAARFVADLNVWMRQTHTYDEKTGWHAKPVLPPGMTERVDVSGNEPIQSQAELSPPGKGRWSMVVEYPREEDRPRETS